MKWSQLRAVRESGDWASPPYLHDTLNEHFRGNVEVPSQDVRSANAPRSLSLLRGQNKAKGALSRPAVTALPSGGRTEIRSEIHAIRRFDLPATEAGIETVQRIGKALAICFGSDPIFQQAARYSRPTTRQFEPGAGTAGIRSKRCGGRHLTGAPPSDRQR